MNFADTSQRNAGDVIVTNRCRFNIMVKAATPVGTQSIGTLEVCASASINTSVHNPWPLFSCAWPGIPVDPKTKKEVNYNSLNFECLDNTPPQDNLGAQTKAGEQDIMTVPPPT